MSTIRAMDLRLERIGLYKSWLESGGATSVILVKLR